MVAVVVGVAVGVGVAVVVVVGIGGGVIMTFLLSGKLPSGKNQIQTAYRNGRVLRYPNKRFKLWRDTSMKQLLEQHCLRQKGWPIRTPCGLVVDYVPGDARTRDLSGMLDALFHLLEKAGLVANDGLIQQCKWTTFPMEKGRARAIVTVQY